jgi:hypothetical protein
MIYDVERNLDLFYREIPDGVFSVCYGISNNNIIIIII